MNLTLAKRVLGFGSLALGLYAVIAPRRFADLVGMASKPEAVAAFGARELGAGAALLSPVKPSPFLWTRVIGDMMDLGGLVTVYREPRSEQRSLLLAMLGVAAITAIDVALAAEATRRKL